MTGFSSVPEPIHVSDHVYPIMGHDAQICGRLVYRSVNPVSRNKAEIFMEVHHQGWVVLVPCRRVNRITDPQGVYILEDGSVWMNADEAPHPVVAELIRVDEGSRTV